MRPQRASCPVIITLVFLLWIALPFSNLIFSFQKTAAVSEIEKRTLAPYPGLDHGSLDPFITAYSLWYNDHFLFREQLLSLHSISNAVLFNKSGSPDDVVIGKNGWFFFVQNEKPLYQGITKITEKELQAISDEIAYRGVLLRQRNILFYVAIAPMKPEIYPENLPRTWHRSPTGTATDRIIEKLKKEPRIVLIDLKDPLQKAKKNGRLYQVTDNHWNSVGGFYAYSAIIDRVKQDFPRTRKVNEKDFSFVTQVRPGGNLANMLGLQKIWDEVDFWPVIRNAKGHPAPKKGYPLPPNTVTSDEYEISTMTGDTTLPRALIIRDSYCNALMPFLDESFCSTEYIFDSWRYLYHPEILDLEKPDLVLLIIFESNLTNLIK